MAINSRESLKQYCLRKLGAPVIKINVSDSQLEDRIDDALEHFHEYHMEGIETVFKKITITQDHIDNQRLTLNDPLIHSVKKIISLANNDNSSADREFNMEYQFVVQELQSFRDLDLISYALLNERLGTIDKLFSTGKLVSHHKYKDEVNLYIKWDTLIAGDSFVVLECERYLDPTSATAIFNDRWLKQYTTALFKRQWGSNTKKLIGVQLPGGVTMAGGDIYNEAVEEIEKLEERMVYDISDPIDFIFC